MFALHTDSTVVLPASGTPFSPQTLTSILQLTFCTSMFAPPALLEAMLRYPPGSKTLSSLQHVGYAGGPLSPSRGEELAKLIPHLFPFFASTEGGPYKLEAVSDSSCWNSFKFKDVGQRMEETSPGVYELVFSRNELTTKHYAFFHTNKSLEIEFRTSDLFSPVDGQPGRWIFRGRADNWVVMSNGLKMDPTRLESHIESHPSVKAALTAGSHRFRLCLLVELQEALLDDDDSAREKALEAIWPTIEEVNKESPQFGQIPRELVILTSKDKPFLRASKGTVQRRLSIAAYEDEIDRGYSEVEQGLLAIGLPELSSTHPENLVQFLQGLVTRTMDITLSNDDDIFQSGVDSLNAFMILARIKAALRKQGATEEILKHISPRWMYDAATIARMAESLSALMDGKNAPNGLSGCVNEVMPMFEKYKKKIKGLSIVSPNINDDTLTQTIVLTGSTGSLGSYILASLLARADVTRVICLNRSTDAEKKQLASFESRGLSTKLLDPEKVGFIQADLTKPQFALSDKDYQILKSETTCIIHNAYPVNFLLSLRSFEPQIQALVNVLTLAAHGQRLPSTLFVSSISAATRAVGERSSYLVPEQVIHAEEAIGELPKQGYAVSKYICERLVEAFTTHSRGQRKALVLRVGQICGPISGTGVWNQLEWFPSLILSSKTMGLLPSSFSGHHQIDWIPVDKVAQITVETCVDKSYDEPFAVLNVVNPKTTKWEALAPSLASVAQTTVEPVEWIEALKAQSKATNMTGALPALKLIDFYESVMIHPSNGEYNVETTKLLQRSKTARELEAITGQNLTRWMRQWGI